jgi:hypothetical protein
MILKGKKQIPQEKEKNLVLVPPCPPQIPHGLACCGDMPAGTYCVSHGTALSQNKKKAVCAYF